MHISKVKIENFKSFKGSFVLNLNEGLNILVGNNEAGKSTILEAIHLALTGLIDGKYIKYELNEYLFNSEVVLEYIQSLKSSNPKAPPRILIELYFGGDQLPIFEGDENTDKIKNCGISFCIELDDSLRPEYNDFVNSEDVNCIPIDYYTMSWITHARDAITPRSIPIKSALIDSSSNKYRNGSDIYISHIIRNNLTSSQR